MKIPKFMLKSPPVWAPVAAVLFGAAIGEILGRLFG
jgi:hypothetical protein